VRLLHTPDEPPFGHRSRDGALSLSHQDIYTAATRAAHTLIGHGVSSGDRVLIILPTGLGFIAAFHACQLLGAVPVPVVPPWSLKRLTAHVTRIARIAAVCEARVTISESELFSVLRVARTEDQRHVALPSPIDAARLFADSRAEIAPASVQPDDTALLQFTSGSVGDPKGVMLSHRALLANIHGIGQALALGPQDIGCSWLPLFHDMGLIGHLLVPQAFRVPTVLLPPEVFMRTPRTWLQVITRYGATISTAPNFAYDLCASRLNDADVAELDLSHWRVAMCGGEPVQASTLEKFTRRFARSGFNESSLLPVYGLAESVLGVTFPAVSSAPKFDTIERTTFEQTGEAVPCHNGRHEEALRLTCVGKPLPGHELRIVTEDGSPCPERRIGHIELSGPSLMSGYFCAAQGPATNRTLKDGWLRTGDLGYLSGGELYVAGRDSEMIVKAGRNLFPYEIEAASANVAGIRAGRSVAFGLPNSELGTEDLVVVCETREPDGKRREQLELKVRASVFERTGARPDVVLIVPPDALSKTSSGKLQRRFARERLQQQGTLTPAKSDAWLSARVWAARLWDRLLS
jgi:acyl-CoA synthetase (AMP-forming)/AMP-acid ligase II